MKFSERNFQFFSWLAGAALVVLWTLLRFASRSSTYDLTTQQVLAHSWLHGFHEHIVLGPTNYLIKIFAFYMPFDLLPGQPRTKLILLTILINLLTFALIYIALRGILREFKIKTDALAAGMLWLAAAAGSVFWINYANSRNLEVAGGMFVVWLGLKMLPRPDRRLMIWLLAISSLTFFADRLQIFMSALPLLVYGLIGAWRGKYDWRRLFNLVGIIVMAIILAAALTAAAEWLLHYSVDSTPGSQSITVSNLPHAVVSGATSTVRQLDGVLNAGLLRTAANLLFVCFIAAAFIYGCLKKRISRDFGLFILVFLVIIDAVYIFSGQALQTDTSRYLINLGPIAVLAIGAALTMTKPQTWRWLMAAIVVVNLASLGWRLHRVQPADPDSHLVSVESYLRSNPAIAWSSMDTATPLAYYQPSLAIYPLSCFQHELKPAYAYRQRTTPSADEKVLLIMDGDSIRNAPNICGSDDVIRQYGQPASIDKLNDGSLVYVYGGQGGTRTLKP